MEDRKKTFISHLGGKTSRKELKCPLARDIGEGKKGKMAIERLTSTEYIPKLLY